MTKTLAFTLTALLAIPAASFAVSSADIEAQVVADMKTQLSGKVVQAIKAQNAEHGPMNPGEIEKLNQQWSAELQSTNRPLINKVMASPASKELQQMAASGKYTNIIVTDNKALNVGLTAPETTYWHDDGIVFSKIFPNKGATLSGGTRYDLPTESFVGSMNGVIDDGENAVGIYMVSYAIKVSPSMVTGNGSFSNHSR